MVHASIAIGRATVRCRRPQSKNPLRQFAPKGEMHKLTQRISRQVTRRGGVIEEWGWSVHTFWEDDNFPHGLTEETDGGLSCFFGKAMNL